MIRLRSLSWDNKLKSKTFFKGRINALWTQVFAKYFHYLMAGVLTSSAIVSPLPSHECLSPIKPILSCWGNFRRWRGLCVESSQRGRGGLILMPSSVFFCWGMLLGPSTLSYFWFARHADVLSGSLGCTVVNVKGMWAGREQDPPRSHQDGVTAWLSVVRASSSSPVKERESNPPPQMGCGEVREDEGMWHHSVRWRGMMMIDSYD